MATCKMCGKRGLFLRLGSHKACRDCELALLGVPDRVRLINESIDIVSQTSNLETAFSRIQFEKMQVDEIEQIAAERSDPLLLLGYDTSLPEMSEHINCIHNDMSDLIDALFCMIKSELEINGPMPLKDIAQFFQDHPEYWIEKYDISKSIKSLLENRGSHYKIFRNKIKNKYYYYLINQEGIFDHMADLKNHPKEIPFRIKSGRIPSYPDFDVLSELEHKFMLHLKNALSENGLNPLFIELTRLSDKTFDVDYANPNRFCCVGKINLNPSPSFPDTYAVMKNGQKRAKRVLPSEEDAKAYMEKNGGDYIEFRPGSESHYYMQYLYGNDGTDIGIITSSNFQDYINGISHWIKYIKKRQRY